MGGLAGIAILTGRAGRGIVNPVPRFVAGAGDVVLAFQLWPPTPTTTTYSSSPPPIVGIENAATED